MVKSGLSSVINFLKRKLEFLSFVNIQKTPNGSKVLFPFIVIAHSNGIRNYSLLIESKRSTVRTMIGLS